MLQLKGTRGEIMEPLFSLTPKGRLGKERKKEREMRGRERGGEPHYSCVRALI